MNNTPVVVISAAKRIPVAERFQGLADVPSEIEWFENLGNDATRRAYKTALQDFMQFTGIVRPDEFRLVMRSHVIAWRDELVGRMLSGMTVRHRLAALSSLFEYLCERNTVTHNPVKGVKRPPVEGYEGKTPAIGDNQARKLLDAPDSVSIKGKRDRAILATLLYHALRRDELCKLTIKDFKHERRGVAHMKVSGKGCKTRYVPLHPAVNGLIADYLKADGRGLDASGSLFRPMRSNRADAGSRNEAKAITPDAIYKIVRSYSAPSVSRSGPMLYVRRPRPMRSITRPISPRCRSGLGTPTSRPRGSTIIGRPGQKTVRRLRSRIDGRFAVDTSMRKLIPAPLIAVCGDLMSRRETHASLDGLFMYAGAPGDLPEGSKPVKGFLR